MELLADSERDYLNGEKEHGEYKRRIKNKINNLPQSIQRLIDDLVLLEEEGFLNEEDKVQVCDKITDLPGRLGKEAHASDTRLHRLPNYRRNRGIKYGKEVGKILSLFAPVDKEGKEGALEGCKYALFPEEDPRVETIINILEAKMEDYKKSQTIIKKRVEQEIDQMYDIIEDVGEEECGETLSEDIKDVIFQILFSKIEEDMDVETYRKVVKKIIREHNLVEKNKLAKKLHKDSESIQSIHWRGVEATEVFKEISEESNKEEDKPCRNDVANSLRKPKQNITKVIREINESEPKILDVTEFEEDHNYELTDYGKCLRDFIDSQSENKSFTDLIIDSDLPQHWQYTLEEYFS